MRGCRGTRPGAAVALCASVLWVVAGALPFDAQAEQASGPASAAAGQLDAGSAHTCALLSDASVRCWGFNGDGQLGYGNTSTVGDDETPASVGPVDLGPGRTAKAISAGDYHTCAVLDDGSVRCWGFGGDGRLGYGNTASVGANQTPGSVGPVNLGGHAATAITAGSAHTCALLDDGSVRCWGFGYDGRLGYGTTTNVGDKPTTTPDKAGPVSLGVGHTAKAISAGDAHTCAMLDDGSVRCWGNGGNGRLGYGNQNNVGDRTTPDSAGPVNLGQGHSATAISSGGVHTCAVLDDGSVRCWGYGGNGRLGYANTQNIGDDKTPDSAGPVNLDSGRTAKAISAGEDHTCAVLDDGTVRCWGYGLDGRLGYGNQHNVGDHETPASAGAVNLGAGRTAVAVSAGARHSCARLDDGTVRCWGDGANGRLGYCNQDSIGDDETPGSVGPVALEPGGPGAGCASAGGSVGGSSATAPAAGAVQSTGANKLPVASDALRARDLRGCLAGVASHAQLERRLAQRGSARQRARSRRHMTGHAGSGRRRCLGLYARTPGQVAGLRALTLGKTQIELSFIAPGTDGNHPPAAHSYLVKQSLAPIRNERDFARAQPLCAGSCRFTISQVDGPNGGQAPGDFRGRCLARPAVSRFAATDTPASTGRSGGRTPMSRRASRQSPSGVGGLLPGACISLTVTDLKAHTTYYYAVAARDNVSARRGPRSQAVKARTS